ncbi:MAG TPA: ABC transporter ATP-binding protein [Peptococcaceae bacterium]|nr:ABC transporter ATP-binding protein [Peptococcaceae bacterium]
MLEIRNLHVHYGGIHALKGITLTVPEGRIVSLIGANGAGKSTTLRAICGLVKPTSGEITYNGKSLVGLPTQDIILEGITMVPEGRRVFPNLTVYENLLLGAYARNDVQGISSDIKRVFELFPRLEERQNQLAGTLSGGEQQMLALGRALMSRPKLLMMDEPSLGLAPLVVKNIFEKIKQIHDEGTTILLIEQNAKAALELSDYAYVLETGKIVLEGTGRELISNSEVKKAYLGEEIIGDF